MSTTETARRYTPEDLIELNDDGRYELVGGKLLACPTSVFASLVSGVVLARLGDHVYREKAGHVFGGGLGYRCFLFDPGRIRLPNGSFIRAGRISTTEMNAEFMTVTPDIVVQVVSPDDLAAQLIAKVADYHRVHVKLVWVVYPETRTVDVHRPDGTGRRLHEEDELTGENVLPGFRCTVRDLFPKLDAGE